MNEPVIRKYKFPDYENMTDEQLDSAVHRIQSQMMAFDDKAETKKSYVNALFKAAAISLKAHYLFKELFDRHNISKEQIDEWVELGQKVNLLKNISEN